MDPNLLINSVIFVDMYSPFNPIFIIFELFIVMIFYSESQVKGVLFQIEGVISGKVLVIDFVDLVMIPDVEIELHEFFYNHSYLNCVEEY